MSSKVEHHTEDVSVLNIEPDALIANGSKVGYLDFGVATWQTAYIIERMKLAQGLAPSIPS